MRWIKVILIVIILAANCNGENNITWINPVNNDNIVVNGLAWFEQNDYKFIRLPLSEQKNIPIAVWRQSLCPSSARIRFKTDSTSLRLKIAHGDSNHKIDMWHMSSVGVAGIDLYIGKPGEMNFWTTSKPKHITNEYEHEYYTNMPQQMREITLYLPSYCELADLEIGIDFDAKVLKATDYKYKKPIVFYGSSITQSGCAGRGSNGFVPIVERKLNCDVVNLGFSGSGKGEPVMAQLMLDIDASVYIVDCVANMSVKLMNERYEKFVRILRQNKPQVPIVLMTKIHYSQEIDAREAAGYVRQNRPVFDTYQKLLAEGNDGVFLFDAGKIIPVGGEHPSVDGHHLTDRGFYKIADELTPILKQILESEKKFMDKNSTHLN